MNRNDPPFHSITLALRFPIQSNDLAQLVVTMVTAKALYSASSLKESIGVSVRRVSHVRDQREREAGGLEADGGTVAVPSRH